MLASSMAKCLDDIDNAHQSGNVLLSFLWRLHIVSFVTTRTICDNSKFVSMSRLMLVLKQAVEDLVNIWSNAGQIAPQWTDTGCNN